MKVTNIFVSILYSFSESIKDLFIINNLAVVNYSIIKESCVIPKRSNQWRSHCGIKAATGPTGDSVWFPKRKQAIRAHLQNNHHVQCML